MSNEREGSDRREFLGLAGAAALAGAVARAGPAELSDTANGIGAVPICRAIPTSYGCRLTGTGNDARPRLRYHGVHGALPPHKGCRLPWPSF